MPESFLFKDSTSLDAAKWSDAIGFADSALLTIPEGVNVSAGASLDQSAFNIDHLKITEGASGVIGSSGAPLKLGGFDASVTPFVSNFGNVKLFLEADDGGTNDLIEEFDAGGSSDNFLVAGIFSALRIYSGKTAVQSAAVLGTGSNSTRIWGGQVTLEDAAGVPTLFVAGGTVLVKRGYTKIVQTGGLVMLDCASESAVGTRTMTEYEQFGGTMRALSGDDIVTMRSFAGTLDFSSLRRDMDVGSTTFEVGDTQIIESSRADLTNITSMGQDTAGIRESAPAA